MKREFARESFLRVAPDNLAMEVVAEGLGLCEGPVWVADDEALLFTDLAADAIWRWRPGRALEPVVRPAGRPNGLALDRLGRVVVAGWAARSIWRINLDGSQEVLATTFQGVRINTPNDVIVAPDGAVLFTDPAGGLVNPGMAGADLQRYLDFDGVFRLDEAGQLTLLLDDFAYPNGLCLSPDASLLFVDDTRRQHVRVFEVRPDGSLSAGRLFFQLVGDEPGAADGIKVDQEGNVYVAGPGGIQVCDASGQLLGRLLLPAHVTNFGWGGDDWRWLHVTTWSGVYRLHLGLPGLPTGTRAWRT